MSSSNYVVRELLPADVDAVCEMERELFPQDWMSACTILNELDRGPAYAVTCEEEVLGYALTNVRNGICDIIRLGVSKKRQGVGIGRYLLEAALRSRRKLWMLTVQTSNAPAIRLYKAFGFTLYGVVPTSLVLVKT